VRARLAEGWEQVVVIGAGFDTLAARLSIEFRAQLSRDRPPATQAGKRVAIGARRGISISSPRICRAPAFRTPFPEGAVSPRRAFGVHHRGPAHVPRRCGSRRCFATLREGLRAGVRVVFTVMDRRDGAIGHSQCDTAGQMAPVRWSEPFKSSAAR